MQQAGQLTLPHLGLDAQRDRTTEEIFSDWNAPGSAGFYNWLRDVQPRVIHRDSKYRPFKPTPKQRETIEEILAVDSKGRLKHTFSLIIAPRRHGKSLLHLILALWLTTSRAHHITQLLGTIETHTRRTMMRPLTGIVRNTPALAKLIPDESISNYEIHFHPLGSVIQMSGGVTTATAFGERISLLLVGDLHASPDLATFNALQASLLDSSGSRIFCDSNVDPTGSVVHQIQKEAATDPGMYCEHVAYKDFKDFRAKAPPWIDRDRAKRLKKTSLPADFKRDILGQRSSVVNALFTPETIKQCKASYRAPVQDVAALVEGRAYKIGGALDRSKSLIAGGRRDRTVWTTCAKVASPQGEPEIFVLNSKTFPLNLASAIKAEILADHERYNLDNVVFENFETADLFQWAVSAKLPCELVSPHDTKQNISFPELARIAREGRLHAPSNLKGLFQEMSTFVYEYNRSRGGNKYTFGSANKSKFKDDQIYSLNWAVFALRKVQLSMYQLGSVVCTNRTPKHRHCFILGGTLEMFCSETCPAYQQINDMWKQYRALILEDEIDLINFYCEKVKRVGALVRQAA